ncbi:MAG: sugar ABC transporter substrate-binding protein, partial [Prochlorococcus sp.]
MLEQLMTVLRIRRKIFSLALVVVGAASIGWGCRSKQDSAADLQFWTLELAPKFNPYMKGVITNWDRDNPDAPVRWTDLPWGSVERK